MSAAKMKPTVSECKDSVKITESDLPTGVLFKNNNLVSNISNWHKFIIKNCENLSRNFILSTILDHVHPFDLIPVHFKWEKKEASFLARNCGAAIKKICSDNLVIPNPSNSALPFKLNIILKFSTTSEFTVDVQKNVLSILNKRYNSIKKVLDLTKFGEDPDITEYCPLSQPKIMYFVLHLSRSLTPFPEVYLLGKNRIKELKPLEVLNKVTTPLSLDLRDNLIDSFDSLSALKSVKCQELTLDGNPICSDCDYETYLNNVTSNCKTLVKLDGVLFKEGLFAAEKHTYWCSEEGVNVANDFLEHFYTLYDSKNRKTLEGMYHKDALFSLNTNYNHGQVTSSTSDLRKYNNIARNFKKIADIAMNDKHLFKGSFQIVNVLHGLPLTEHDPFSFKVDLTYFTPTCAVIGVTGVFRELPEALLEADKYYGFKRTFVLQMGNENGETYIINDMFHVFNAYSFQVVESFKISKPVPMELTFEAKTEEEQQKVLNILKAITTMNDDWAKKCLEECKFNLKDALTLFVDLFKKDKIPNEAFELTQVNGNSSES